MTLPRHMGSLALFLFSAVCARPLHAELPAPLVSTPQAKASQTEALAVKLPEPMPHDLAQPEEVTRETDKPLHKGLMLASLTGLYGGTSVWAYFAWYREPPNPFSFNEDGWFGMDTYSGGADKLGHAFATHLFMRTTAGLLDRSGWERSQSSLIAGGLTTIFFTLIEIKDGYHYAFSMGDVVANTAGVGLGFVMRHWPGADEMFDFRLAYYPSPAFVEKARRTPTVNIAEDYSGQTYLLAYHLASLSPVKQKSYLRPFRYVDLVAGFRTVNFKPTPIDPRAERRQDVFLGVALNTRETLRDSIFFAVTPQSPAPARTAAEFSDYLFEYFSVPGTTLPVLSTSR
jgi:hypothetical protein